MFSTTRSSFGAPQKVAGLKWKNFHLTYPLISATNSEEWNGYGLFEYLLRVRNRSGPVESARFLSYIAPYWLCGDSDSAIVSRPSRLRTLHQLIGVLEDYRALDLAILTNCMLCVGAAMDFPLHPEDLIRVDKRHVQLLGMSNDTDW